MHCKVTCTIDAEKELVLAALEQQLRRTPGDVEREGDTLVLLGLGPSPRAINRRNRTVFTLESLLSGTTIVAEATFQASSMIPPEGQEDLVREELERIFAETAQSIKDGSVHREQEEIRRAEEASRREEIARREAEAAAQREAQEREARAALQREIRAQALREVEAARLHQAEVAEEAAGPHEDTPHPSEPSIASADDVGFRIEEAEITSPVREQQPADPMPSLSEVDRAAALARRHEAEKRLEDFRRREAERVQAEREAAARALNAATEARQNEKQTAEADAHTAGYSEDMRYRDSTAWEEENLRNPPKPQRRWLLWGVLAACLLAAIPIARHYLASDEDTVEPTNSATVSPTPTSSASASPESALRVWELALRSHDAASQAALYTSPVEEYMGQRNLTHQQLTATQKAEMAKRRSPWNIRIENISVDRQGDTATVHLTKHIVEHPPGRPTVDTKIPSVLTLKATGGMWWIASEDDAAPAQTTAASTAPAPKSQSSKRSRRRRGR